MAREIERKFLVRDASILAALAGEPIDQGYLAGRDGLTVRVRRIAERAYLTVKGPAEGISRDEFEYAIPLEDARLMLERYCAGQRLRKTRYRVPYAGQLFEVDVFSGALEGLVMAELELPDPDAPVSLPPWIGREVSGDRRYDNSALARAGRPPAD
jgi:CYTH domain-containing protein